MTEFKMFMQATNGQVKHQTSIIQYPKGKFGFVGNVPDKLCRIITNSMGNSVLVSRVYQTKQEAEKALKEYR